MDPIEFALIYIVVFAFNVFTGLSSLCFLFLIILGINEIDNKESNEGIQFSDLVFDFIYCIIGFITSLCFLIF